MSFSINDRVRVDRCDVCPAIVGKMATIKGIDGRVLTLNYGRGRPLANRPSSVNVDEVSLVKEIFV